MAASGPWNNLLTWIILTLIASTRLWTLIYHDYSDQGRVVLDVNFVSIVTRLVGYRHRGELKWGRADG